MHDVPTLGYPPKVLVSPDEGQLRITPPGSRLAQRTILMSAEPAQQILIFRHPTAKVFEHRLGKIEERLPPI